MIDYAVMVQPKTGAGEDRAAVYERENGLVVVLADGAGGMSHGDFAAETVVEALRNYRGNLDMLYELDVELGGGQTTVVVLAIDQNGIHGASIGDSEAWLVGRDLRITKLTTAQRRKPLLGARNAEAVAFSSPFADETLLVASDGLFRYATSSAIARIANGDDLYAVASELVDLPRSSGQLVDDVSVVLCRYSRSR